MRHITVARDGNAVALDGQQTGAGERRASVDKRSAESQRGIGGMSVAWERCVDEAMNKERVDREIIRISANLNYSSIAESSTLTATGLGRAASARLCSRQIPQGGATSDAVLPGEFLTWSLTVFSPSMRGQSVMKKRQRIALCEERTEFCRTRTRRSRGCARRCLWPRPTTSAATERLRRSCCSAMAACRRR